MAMAARQAAQPRVGQGGPGKAEAFGVLPPALAGEALAWAFKAPTGTRDARHA